MSLAGEGWGSEEAAKRSVFTDGMVGFWGSFSPFCCIFLFFGGWVISGSKNGGLAAERSGAGPGWLASPIRWAFSGDVRFFGGSFSLVAFSDSGKS